MYAQYIYIYIYIYIYNDSSMNDNNVDNIHGNDNLKDWSRQSGVDILYSIRGSDYNFTNYNLVRRNAKRAKNKEKNLECSFKQQKKQKKTLNCQRRPRRESPKDGSCQRGVDKS